MTGEAIAPSVLKQARSLIADGTVGDAYIRRHGELGQAIPVRNSKGEHKGWLVPIVIEDRLAAWLQFLPDLTLVRFSTFMRHPGSLGDCPPAALWLDPDVILKTASRKAAADEHLEAPVLTYDQDLTRLAWAVMATDPQGRSRRLMVVGNDAYEVEPPD